MGGGGGTRAQNYLELIWMISLSCERCWRPHQEILFLVRVMIFWKLRFACDYSTRENLSRHTRKLLLWTFLRKPPIQKFWRLVYTYYRFDLGIWEILFFSDFIGTDSSKIQICRYSHKEGINQAYELLDGWFFQEGT